MIPVSLTIQGLYSYQEKQTIDFVKLTEAHIFGIFGIVGCGKSSILEAITFALYGKTDRLNVSGDQRNYNMMNLKSDDLLIDFIFHAGSPRKEYRIRVSGKRSKSNFEDVKSFDRLFYTKQENDWIPSDVETIEQIVGLSYDNFRRTIIIPQNKFQEFLQLGDKDRSKMMKDLFHLDRFELFYQVSDLEKINNEKLQNLEGQLEQLKDVNQDMIENSENNAKEFKTKINGNQIVLSELKNDESKLKELKSLFDQLHSVQHEFNLLENRRGEFEKLKDKLKHYEFCLIHFKPGIDRLDELNKDIIKLSADVQENEDLLLELQQNLKKALEQFKVKKEKFSNREKLKEEAEDLKRIVDILSFNQRTNLYSLTKRSLGLRLDEINKRYTDVQQTIKELKTKIQRIRESLPDLTILNNIKNWFLEKSRLEDKKTEIEEELKILSAELIQHEASLRSIKEKFHQWDEVERSKNNTELSTALGKIESKLESQISLLENSIEHLSIQQKLKDYVDEITVGRPCPLCGSVDHPNIMSVEKVEEELSQKRQEKLSLNSTLGDIKKSIQLLSTTIDLINKANIKGVEKDKQLAAVIKNLTDHFDHFSWQDYKGASYELINSTIAETEKSQIIIRQYEEENAREDKKEEGLIAERENLKLDLITVENQITQLKAQSELLKTQLKSKKLEDFETVTEENINLEIKALKDQYQTTELEYQKADRKKVQFERTIDTTTGTLKNQKLTLIAYQNQFDAFSGNVNEKIKRSNYTDQETVRNVLAEKVDLSVEKQRVTEYYEQYREISNRLAGLKNKTEGKNYDPIAHQQNQADILNQETGLQELNQQLGGILTSIIKLKEGLKNKTILEKTQKELNLKGNDLTELKTLFRASGFVNYISSIYMKNLCAAANDRFHKLTRQNLMLELTEDNNFQVRDFLNGGKVRSIKTLSGGQTFQAALSLALALAANIQSIYKSDQNFFFLDEGFGTLDKESLSIVFETLKSLRKENRIVGVISHVEEMQQEIETHLKIINDTERGSLITASWE